jgi:thiazole synthase ThiGH ThiG subunit
MGYSYQDIESRLRSTEDKLDFIMKSFTMTKTYHMPNLGLEGGYKTVKEAVTLAQLYRELKGLGAEVVDELLQDAPKTAQDAPGTTQDSGTTPNPVASAEAA